MGYKGRKSGLSTEAEFLSILAEDMMTSSTRTVEKRCR